MIYKLVTDKLLNCLKGAIKKLQCSLGEPGGIATLGEDGILTSSQRPGGGGGSGTVTSVALSAPSGLTITGSPVTTNGTLAITGAGTTAQYLRGDVSLATFPTTVSTFTNDSGYVTASSTNTFTNKTYDTAGSGNVFRINGTAVSAVTGTGSAVLATSPTITTPVISSIVNTGTLTLPTSTDTLIGKATTDTLTNKTFDTAGTGNVFKINGVTITANTGTGSNVLATSPTITTPTIAALANLTTNGFIKTGSSNGTLSVDTNTYLTANQTITLSGDVSGSGTTAITTAIGANKVTLGMQATLAANTVIGNSTGSTATPTAVNVPMTIASGTVTNAATLDINMSAYYNLFTTIEVQLISFRPATNAAILEARLSIDGTTFITTGYKWNFVYAIAATNGGQDDAGAADTTTIHLTGTSSSTTAQTISGEVRIYNPGVATFFPMVKFDMARYNDGPNTAILSGMGLLTTAQVNKGIRILFSSGNISTGIYRVIGYV